MKNILVDRMTWTEFRDAMKHNDTLIIPTGVMEQHGPHNPLGADFQIAEHCARLIGEKSGVPVASTIPHGCCADMTKFPGTTSLDPDTYYRLLLAVCENYMAHGVRRFVIVSGHSGNTPTMNAAAAELYNKYGVLFAGTDWWTIWPQMDPEIHCLDHGSYFETSMMLAADEKLVDLTKGKFANDFPLSEKLKRHYYWHFDGANIGLVCDMRRVNPYGNVGDATKGSTKELGERMTERYVDFVVDLIEELRKLPIHYKGN